MPSIERLKKVMAKLRDPGTGCPWDKEQTFKSITSYTIEEAYEVVDAIERNNVNDLKDELGDLLLQVIYHSQIATEQNLFTFDDVTQTITDKMIRRHPHVFDNRKAESTKDVDKIWEEQKALENNEKGALSGITKGLPSLLRAQKIQKKAANTGFEWQNTQQAFKKIEEEIEEFKEAKTLKHKEEELGDLLFCLVNYARMNDLNAEEALRKANNKFIKRFSGIETDLQAKHQNISDLTLDEMLDCWTQQKHKA